jgi:hypothetical protein
MYYNTKTSLRLTPQLEIIHGSCDPRFPDSSVQNQSPIPIPHFKPLVKCSSSVFLRLDHKIKATLIANNLEYNLLSLYRYEIESTVWIIPKSSRSAALYIYPPLSQATSSSELFGRQVSENKLPVALSRTIPATAARLNPQTGQ